MRCRGLEVGFLSAGRDAKEKQGLLLAPCGAAGEGWMIQAGSARGVFQSALRQIPGEGRNSFPTSMDLCPRRGEFYPGISVSLRAPPGLLRVPEEAQDNPGAWQVLPLD